MAYAYMHRLTSAGFGIDGKSFGVFGHDWRTVPPGIWLELMADRELDEHIRSIQPVPGKSLLVLNQTEFLAALKTALHDLDRPDKLENNPLLHSRLVSDQSGTGDHNADHSLILISEIKKAILTLQNSPRDEKYFRVMEKTYLKSARSQEKASEDLNLPFSTYRRHLKAGITRIAQILWQKEINKG